MIIRHAARAARRALGQPAAPPWRRFLSTPVDTRDSSENNLQPPHSLKAPSTAAAPAHHKASDSLGPDTAATGPLSDPSTESVASQYYRFKQQQALFGKLGSEIAPHFQPHTLLSNPPSSADVTLELLLASEAHQGHATPLWNPANARYIHGIRQGVHIIALEATAAHLRRAAKIVQEVSRRGGLVLFVGTREGQDRVVSRASELAKGYHLFERWIPGSITNGQQILGKCRTKVVNEKDEEVPGFEDQLRERPVLRPDLVVCLNPLENYVLLHECALNNIPTIGVIDTNADPTWVTYPIPANDDSLRCIQVIAGVLGRAGEAGQKSRLALAEQGKATYAPPKNLKLPETLKEEGSKDPRESSVHDPTKLEGDVAGEGHAGLGEAMVVVRARKEKNSENGGQIWEGEESSVYNPKLEGDTVGEAYGSLEEAQAAVRAMEERELENGGQGWENGGAEYVDVEEGSLVDTDEMAERLDEAKKHGLSDHAIRGIKKSD